jgi:hypothetical protein
MTGATVAGIASAVIALLALIFSVVSFARQQARAAVQQRASIKPLLWIHPQRYVNRKALFLRNYGLGPAIIRRAEFMRDGRAATNRIVELFELPRSFMWETFDSIEPRRAIPAQGEITLVLQSLEHLMRQGIEEADGLRLLETWQQQRHGIRVVIEYEDILGNAIEPLSFTFT